MNRDRMLEPDQIAAARASFATDGYALCRDVYDADEVEELRRHFEAIHRDHVPGFYEPPRELPDGDDDILKLYPRIMQPHRFSELVRGYLTLPRVCAVLEALFGEPPMAAQSMFYFKPPGARGQVIHQDQFYLQVKPGTCIAAWAALDRCDRGNGGMVVVPGSQHMAIDCSKLGGPGSYSEGAKPVRIPPGHKGIAAEMEPGDMLFFNGSLLHGSARNRSTDRWRRAFICHYVGLSCDTISQAYLPLVGPDGRDVERGATLDGGPCGSGWGGAAH